MPKFILIKNKANNFNKIINVDGDKSLSIRWALIASQAIGISRAFNLPKSEDVLSTLKCLKKLGVKIFIKKNFCEIHGKGMGEFNYKKNLKIDAGNSGTLARLILGMLIKSKKKIILSGDKSLSRRDFSRIIIPLQKMGIKAKKIGNNNLPIAIQGTNYPRPIIYKEKIGSAQCKSSVMFAGLFTPGITTIKAKKSRDHTERLLKYLKVPITIKKTKHFDLIKVGKVNYINSINYKIPSDISSSAFFIVLTLLLNNSSLKIKNIISNQTRTGIIKILNSMGARILIKNKKIYKGEPVGDLYVKSVKNIRPINCPVSLNSSAIDEFLIIFLFAAKANGVSYFKNLSELDNKESPRLKLGSKILNMIGVKTKLTKNSIRIYGKPNLNLKKNYIIKDYYKDHRILMMCVIAALSLGGKWKIYDPDSAKTSFPSFFDILKKINSKIMFNGKKY